MVKKKKPSKEELEDILFEEEIQEIYDSIDTKELDRKEKEREWYKEYTKPDLHPISYQVEQEMRFAPQFGITDEYVQNVYNWAFYIGIGVMSFWYLIGLWFLILMVR